MRPYPDFAPGEEVRVMWDSGRVTTGICVSVEVKATIIKVEADSYRIVDEDMRATVRIWLQDFEPHKRTMTWRNRVFERRGKDDWTSAQHFCTIARA